MLATRIHFSLRFPDRSCAVTDARVYTFQIEAATFGEAGPGVSGRLCQGLAQILNGVAHFNVAYILEHPTTPLLYESGIKYEYDEWWNGKDPWRDIPRVLQLGRADCDDIVPWRLAELWLRHHIEAAAYVERYENDNRVINHALVRYPNGFIEDPTEEIKRRFGVIK